MLAFLFDHLAIKQIKRSYKALSECMLDVPNINSASHWKAALGKVNAQLSNAKASEQACEKRRQKYVTTLRYWRPGRPAKASNGRYGYLRTHRVEQVTSSSIVFMQ